MRLGQKADGVVKEGSDEGSGWISSDSSSIRRRIGAVAGLAAIAVASEGV